MIWWTLLGIPLLFILCIGIGRHWLPCDKSTTCRWLIWTALVVMGAVRLGLAASVEGYACDVHTFQAWAMRAGEDLGGFYSSGFFADYPPGYMYVLAAIGKIKALLALSDDGPAFLLLIKLPAIIADLTLVLLIYRLAASKFGHPAAMVLSLIYGLNPAVILNSSVWGQVDAVFTLFLILSVYCLSHSRLLAAAALFAVALLIKPQALIFTPLFLATALDRLLLRPERGGGKEVLAAMVTGMAVFIAGIIPFALHQGPLWIFSHYRATLTSYPFASVNAYNLFALSGANFLSESAPWLIFHYRSWGTFFIVIATLCAFRIYFAGSHENRLYLMGLFLVAAVFIFSSRMHERYLFPALIFALLAALYTGNPSLLAIFTGFSLTHYLNVAHVLLESTRGVTHIPRFDPILIGTAIGNLLLFAWLLRIIMAGWRMPNPLPAPE